MAKLSDSVAKVVGGKSAEVLQKAFGMKTLEDLLRHYPRRYVVRGELSNISELREGDDIALLFGRHVGDEAIVLVGVVALQRRQRAFAVDGEVDTETELCEQATGHCLVHRVVFHHQHARAYRRRRRGRCRGRPVSARCSRAKKCSAVSSSKFRRTWIPRIATVSPFCGYVRVVMSVE